MIKHDTEKITLDVVTSIYKNKLRPLKDQLGRVVKDDTGKTVKGLEEVWHKDLKLKTIFYKNDIRLRGETLTRTDKIAKSRCIIFDRCSGKFFTVAHPLKEIEEILSKEESITPVGFKKY
jgi:hypothetical protein